MAEKRYLTAPVPTTGMPPGIPFIVANEAAERFSFYGMRAILVVFMTHYLRDGGGRLATMTENDANTWYHAFLASNYFFPIFGAILMDAFWGKYRTIISLSLVYCCGHAALAINDTRTGLVVGLGLIAIGAGGIKPGVSANVGDQFGATNAHLLSKAFGWFYASVNAGSTISFLLIPWLLRNHGPHVAFAVPGVLMLLATMVFWLGRKRFVHIPPAGPAYLRRVLSRDGLSVLGRLASIFVFVAVFWSLWDQSGGEWVVQAEHMNLRFLGINWLSEQIQAVNALMILGFIPLFQWKVYPIVSRVFPLNPLRKIGLGIIVMASAFVISAWIESRIAGGERPSIGWQLPAYALLSAAEVMVSVTALEFSYTQAPKYMKSLVSSLYLLAISAGNGITFVVHLALRNDDGTSKLTGPAYYLFFAGLAVAATVVYVFVAKGYRERTYLQEEKAA